MRITKHVLRQAKMALTYRIKEICQSVAPVAIALEDNTELLAEHRRVFPHIEDGQRPAFAAAALNDLLQDALDRAIPSHWVD